MQQIISEHLTEAINVLSTALKPKTYISLSSQIVEPITTSSKNLPNKSNASERSEISANDSINISSNTFFRNKHKRKTPPASPIVNSTQLLEKNNDQQQTLGSDRIDNRSQKPESVLNAKKEEKHAKCNCHYLLRSLDGSLK